MCVAVTVSPRTWTEIRGHAQFSRWTTSAGPVLLNSGVTLFVTQHEDVQYDVSEYLRSLRRRHRLRVFATRWGILTGVTFAVVASATSLRAALRRRRRVRDGLCTACGYDLRATPGRCPECGVQAV